MHSLILLQDLQAADRLSGELEKIGNIHSDGRPVLGLDCHDLLDMTLSVCPDAMYISAHIWTPHFSVFGAFSGFNSMEECFEELTPHIHAVETGLSSDPPMNWSVPSLSRYQLISNSDAHSPSKLGREATLLNTGLSYKDIYNAIQTGKDLPARWNSSLRKENILWMATGNAVYAFHRKKQSKLNDCICPVAKAYHRSIAQGTGSGGTACT